MSDVSQQTKDRGIVLWLIIGVGLVFRIAQFAFDRSLWLDESLLVTNIVSKSYKGLLGPLDHPLQFAPWPFLLVEKWAILTFGVSDHSLRLFPLVFGLLSVLMFYFAAKRILHGSGLIVSLILFAVSGPLIYYSSEVKQYGGDVFMVTAIYAMATHAQYKKLSTSSLVSLGLLGAIAVWLSQPAIFAIAGVLLVFFVLSWQTKDRGSSVGVLAASVLTFASFLLAFKYTILPIHHSRVYMTGYEWVPLKLYRPGNLYWCIYHFFEYLRVPAGFRFVGLAALFLFLGAYSMFKRDPARFWLLFLTGLFGLGTNMLHKYPYAERLFLFTVPAVYLFVGEGFEYIKERTMKHSVLIWQTAAFLLLMHPIMYAAIHVIQPRERAEIKPVLAYMSRHSKPSDCVYVYHCTTWSYDFYKTAYGVQNLKVYLDDTPDFRGLPISEKPLDELKGKDRVWAVFNYDASTVNGDDESLVLNYLDRFGIQIDSFHSVGAAAYLYDLSGSRHTPLIPPDHGPRSVDPGVADSRLSMR
jgi:hypothetical protein